MKTGIKSVKDVNHFRSYVTPLGAGGPIFAQVNYLNNLKINIMSTGKVLLGIIAGAAAGALAGILLAPEKGSKTRKRIIRKGEDYKDEVEDTFNELLDTITEKTEKVKDEISDYADKKMGKTEKDAKKFKG
ncbi:MAG: YtxH domain-containing protein [Bacteroidales bacterium]|nr:YtxH domain-containing protein [Bacteroidales bacterium]